MSAIELQYLPLIGAGIGVVGLVLGALLNDCLTKARDKRKDKRERCRVRAELLACLAEHCENLSRFEERIEPSWWQTAHDELRKRAELPDVQPALGDDYQPFMAALRDEQRCIDMQKTKFAETHPGMSFADADEQERLAVLSREYPAFTRANVASVVATYNRFMTAWADSQP